MIVAQWIERASHAGIPVDYCKTASPLFAYVSGKYGAINCRTDLYVE